MSDTGERIVDDKVLEDAQFDEMFEEVSPVVNLVAASVPTPPDSEKKEVKEDNFSQWAIGGNGRYTPVGASVNSLVPGVYEPFANPGSWGLERLDIASDEIYELPDMATNTVLDEIDRFWNNEARYRQHNLLYKRGVILHGPPGSGKTVCVKLLIKKLIDRGGIVMVIHNVPLAAMCLKAVKRIEPNRNIICIFEDIDEIIHQNGESVVLSVLDGEHNVDRVLNVATTNYPDRLGARIINRPSRFDRRVYVGMPNPEARAYYLRKATNNALSEDDLQKWVADSGDMSIAHLRELVAAVYCLDQPYDEVIARLADMAKQVKSDEEFKRGSLGFGAKTAKRNSDSGW
jgi:hypothetical protein